MFVLGFGRRRRLDKYDPYMIIYDKYDPSDRNGPGFVPIFGPHDPRWILHCLLNLLEFH